MPYAKPRLLRLGLCLLLAGCPLLWANAPRLRFERLTIEDGLSQSTVLDMVRDQSGFMWFATYDGLNRYDGYRFLHYRAAPGDNERIINNEVHALYLDNRGRLWAGTSGGLSLYIQERDAFFSWSTTDSDLPYDRIEDIAQSSNGRILLVGQTGLVTFDPIAGIFRQIAHREGIVIEAVSLAARGDQCWIGAIDGLHRYDAKTDVVQRVTSEPWPYGTIYDVLWDPNGTLWLATQRGGVLAWDIEKASFLDMPLLRISESNPSQKEARALTLDENQNLWVGTDGGLLFFDFQQNTWASFQNQPDNPNSLLDNRIRSVFSDGFGSYWVGSAIGLSRFNLHNPTFRGHTAGDASNDLSDGIVWSVYEDRQGELWVGTDGGLTHFDKQGNRINVITADAAGEKQLLHDAIWAIAEDEAGILWLGSELGFYRYDKDSGSFRNWRHDPKDPRTIPDDWVKMVAPAKNGDIFMGTHRGLRRFNPKDFSYNRDYEWIDPNNPIATQPVRAVLEEDDVLWVGTEGNGLVKRLGDGSRIVYSFERDRPGSLSSKTIRSIHRAQNQQLWVGTDRGLNLMLPDQRFRTITQEDGLPNDVIYGILEDQQGHLWLSTNRGIARFSPESGEIRNFTQRDGLIDNEFNQGAYLASAKGTFYFGGVTGLSIFKPMEVAPQTYAPMPVFSDLTIAGRRIKPGPNALLSKPLHLSPRLVLDHQFRQFSISFMMPNYNHPQGNRFSWRMDKINKTPSPLSKRNDIYFNALDPGTYTLIVEAVNNDGIVSAEPARLQLIIKPPWWLSPWAKTLYALALVFGLFGYLWIQNDRLKRERRVASAERKVADQLRESYRLKTSFLERLEAQVAERTAALQKTTAEVTARNEEHQLFEHILENINNEIDINKIFKVILIDGLKLFPNAGSAAFLIAERDGEYLNGNLIRSGQEETMIQLPRQIYDDVDHLLSLNPVGENRVHNFEDHAFADKIHQPKLRLPKSLIVSTLSLPGGTQAMVVFSNFHNPRAFSRSDQETFSRFKVHAQSALEKAHRLRDLEAKNTEILRNRDLMVMQEKMASLGNLSAGIAHEIKNPLNFVNNFAEAGVDLMEDIKTAIREKDSILLDETVNDIANNLERINLHGKRAGKVVDTLLDLTRAGGGSFERVKPSHFLDSAMQLGLDSNFFGRHRNHLEVSQLFADTQTIYAVPRELTRAFSALVRNMGEAIQARGEDSGTFNPRIELKVFPEDDHVVITLKDNGQGIKPEHMERVFEPFFTTHPPDTGHIGLGLTLCYEILVKGHKGSMDLKSTWGEGTTVTICLPYQ